MTAIPPNGDFAKSLYIWPKDTSDPVVDQVLQATLFAKCEADGINVIFLSYWRYLGTATTPDRVAYLNAFIVSAHTKGIRVFAMGGEPTWVINEYKVMAKNIMPLVGYNTRHESFDGIHLDAEYWTDPTLDANAVESCRRLGDLAVRISTETGLQVGLFLTFSLLKTVPTRPMVFGMQEGQYLISMVDHVVVGAYRNNAASQWSLFQPWLDSANDQARAGVYLGSETINVQPPTISYYGQTKAQFEAAMTANSALAQSETPPGSGWLGHAIHDHVGYLNLL